MKAISDRFPDLNFDIVLNLHEWRSLKLTYMFLHEHFSFIVLTEHCWCKSDTCTGDRLVSPRSKLPSGGDGVGVTPSVVDVVCCWRVQVP